MCGIAGQARSDGRPLDPTVVERMNAAQVHRGPDSGGLHVGDSVVLGVRRLAIIDVAGGEQPIRNEDGSVTVVLNGEIYNFEALRRELEGRGHVFATHADTEVIVHLYEELGPRLVSRLRGMFAFALWDERRRRLVLARDRVGKKPLYYWEDGAGGLTFASELAALLEDDAIPRRLDPRAIDAYLAYLYVPDPLSAIAGVRKLPPASTLVWEDGKPTVDRYWELEYEPKEQPDDVGALIREQLREAVRVRLVSERPLGVFLSGGVDSTAIVATMAEIGSGPVRTFSIGFTSSRFDELPHARRVADLFGTRHEELVVELDPARVLPRLVTHYGDPFGDSSAVPSFAVAEMASRAVTVVLNGDGGDESFAGYNRYASNALVGRLEHVPLGVRRAVARAAQRLPEDAPLDSTTSRVRRLTRSLGLPPPARYAYRMTYMDSALRARLYTPEFAAEVDAHATEALAAAPFAASRATTTVDRMLDADVRTYLPGDLLVKMDIATMAHSLEARSPFLDHELMRVVARLPVREKIRGTTTKVALKEAFRGIVPDDLLDRPKQGFAVPLAEWLRGPLRATAEEVLLAPRTIGRGQLRRPVVAQLLDEHQRGRDRGSELWLLLVLELWQRRFLDREPEGALL